MLMLRLIRPDLALSFPTFQGGRFKNEPGFHKAVFLYNVAIFVAPVGEAASILGPKALDGFGGIATSLSKSARAAVDGAQLRVLAISVSDWRGAEEALARVYKGESQKWFETIPRVAGLSTNMPAGLRTRQNTAT